MGEEERTVEVGQAGMANGGEEQGPKENGDDQGSYGRAIAEHPHHLQEDTGVVGVQGGGESRP